MRICQTCKSGTRLATGVWYQCRDIRSRVMVVVSIYTCRYWRRQPERNE